MVFRSKQDGWLKFLVWTTILVTFVVGISVWFDPSIKPVGSIIFTLIMWSFAIFMAWLAMSTAYIVKEDHLLIRSGPFKMRIRYEDIRKVSRTQSVLAAPALSTQRLEILYRRYDIAHISPDDEDKMLELLQERCPQAVFESDSNV